MIHVEVTVLVRAPQQFVWGRITDWEAHSRWIPFTTVTILERGNAECTVGTKFVGRTGIGPWGFDDVMSVDRCLSPSESGEDGKCWITKLSPALHGNADFHVIKVDEATSKITWVENVSLAQEGVNNRWGGLLSWLGNIAFAMSLRKFARLTAREYRSL